MTDLQFVEILAAIYLARAMHPIGSLVIGMALIFIAFWIKG